MIQLALLIQTIKEQQDNWLNQPFVLDVMPRFQIGDDSVQPTSIQVILQPGRSAPWLPNDIDGIPVGTRAATPQELIYGFIPLSVWEDILLEAGPPPINYVSPDPGEVTLLEREVHTITCHVGPDSG